MRVAAACNEVDMERGEPGGESPRETAELDASSFVCEVAVRLLIGIPEVEPEVDEELA